ncbi:MAG: isoleucine--tRNA ligase, partial [Candidatus Omnitrophota bacterium]
YTHFQEQDKKESVFLSNWPNYQEFKRPELESDFKKIFKLRDDVLKALEEERSKGLIGSSLEAEVKIVTTSEDFNFLKEREDLLREFFIVSKVEVEKGESFSLKVEKAKGKKCLRCWNWREDVGKDKDFEEVCLRCVSVLRTQR